MEPLLSDLHHFEIFLSGAALGADPVHRDVFPSCARRNAFFRQAGRLVIDEAADEAHEGSGLLIVGHGRRKWGASDKLELYGHSIDDHTACALSRA